MSGGSGAGYSPAQEGDLRLWLDASLPSTVSISGGQISSWASRVNAVSLVKAPTAGPTYSSIGWDGVRPCATFGASGYTDIRANSIGGITDFIGDNSQSATLVFRYILTNVAAGGFLWQSYNAGAAYSAIENRYATSNSDIFWSSGGAFKVGSLTYSSGISYTHSSVLSLNTVATYRGNTADIVATAFTPALPADFAIGGGAFTGTLQLQLKLAEALVYKTALSTAAIGRLDTYLSAKWP